MPKDEFDLDDPLELNGVVLATQEDTTDAMCDCFIEEFMRMGYGAERILALFRSPHYVGMNLVWNKRGEPFIRDAITGVFQRWGRSVSWASTAREGAPGLDPEGEQPSPCPIIPSPHPAGEEAGRGNSVQGAVTDPLGAPVPKFRI